MIISYVLCIGNKVTIGSNEIIKDNDEYQIRGQKSIKSIHIVCQVLIATRTAILKVLTIGDNSIIVAGAIVTHDSQTNCLVAGGVPSVFKKRII